MFQLIGSRYGALNGSATPKVMFSELAGTLASDRHQPHKDGSDAVCIWYGGAMLYADVGIDKLIHDVCAHRPDIAARQCEFDMRDHIGETLTAQSHVIDSPRRNRMKI